MTFLSRTTSSAFYLSRVSPLLNPYLSSAVVYVPEATENHYHYVRTTLSRFVRFTSSTVTSSSSNATLSLVTSVYATPRARPANEHDNPSEDAYFIAPLGLSSSSSSSSFNSSNFSRIPSPLSSSTILGIADGVGSWIGIVDPKLYPTALMRNACIEIVEDIRTKPSSYVTEKDYLSRLLQRTWERTAKEKLEGSSTITLVAFNGQQRTLQINNLGDSQVLVLRKNKNALTSTTNPSSLPYQVVYRTNPQTKKFNQPYQLGYSIDPKNEPYFDKPQAQQQYMYTIEENDIILVSSDGMFDNLFEKDILDILIPLYRSFVTDGKNNNSIDNSQRFVQQFTKQLVTLAREYSLDRRRDGPFAVEAKDNDILWSLGGRPDDITVIVGYVNDRPTASSSSSSSAYPIPETQTIGKHLESLVPQNQYSTVKKDSSK